MRGCAALRKKNNAEAEKLFRRAVRDYSKYSVAWVTLGQLLVTEQRASEARDACSKASVADPSYVPAYLCQADIAARGHSWDEVLKLSTRALELDPSGNAVAYEYNAAANLNLRNLVAAEKSSLRAVAADRDHHEPRAHFVLAQVYEAKGDATNEALQLRQYLKYSAKGPDAAIVEQYLAALEQNIAAVAESAAGGGEGSSVPAEREGPPDIDAGVPSVLRDKACPLAQVLIGASDRTLDLIDNMRRFSANEVVEYIDFDRNGNRRNSSTETANYVVEIEPGSSGYPRVDEYRAGGGRQRASFVDLGTAAFALIFHPSHIGNFDFHCEGLTELRGQLAWQVHFVEGADPNRSFSAMRVGRTVELTRFKGRAWISTDNYNVLQIETDLVSPMEKLKLQREHWVIIYAPVEFSSRHIQLWLPESSSLYIAYRGGRRYERIHTLSDFQLFSVDSVQTEKEPANKVFPFDSARWTPPSDEQGRLLGSLARAESH